MRVRDDFIVGQIKSKRLTFGALSVLMAATAAGSLAACVACVVLDKLEGLVVFVASAASFAAAARVNWAKRQTYVDALAEIGDDPAYLDGYHDYSQPTMGVLREVQVPAKTLLQLTVAYGVIEVMLIAACVLILAISGGEPVLVGAGAICVGLAIFLGILTADAFLGWRRARQSELFI